jgi:hypothetical protein
LREPIEAERETHSVIVFTENRQAVVAVPNGSAFRLPSFDIPRGVRTAEHLTLAVERAWGRRVICLFPLQIGSSPGRLYQVMEFCQASDDSLPDASFLPVSSLDEKFARDSEDLSAIRQSLSESQASEQDSQVSPFARPGFLKQLVEWIDHSIRTTGLQLTGRFRQFNATSSFSLIRFETNRSALWFKAVGEPNRREFPITVELSERFPGYVPTIVATRSDLCGWLSEEADGHMLGRESGLRDWSLAAESLAVLQTRSIESTNRILALGAHDLGLDSMSFAIGPMFSVIRELMARQEKKTPAPLGSVELRWLSDRIQFAIGQLERFAVPNALGHLDLNPGNIVVNASRTTFLDWAEAYIGPPVLSFSYLLEHFRRVRPRNSLDEEYLVTAYENAWRPYLRNREISEILAPSSLLAVFTYAASYPGWRDTDSLLRDARAAGFFRSLARRMYREAALLEGGRDTCGN